ncbi:MAG: hypothetical protein SFW36_05180 [Leptolyngbyaceae cyanobacterium bins.59]|nr:hypothetical protein [Leptolyngbyaceae cyanobacterium bins.59]
MPNQFSWLIPNPQPQELEILQAYIVTHDFYREVKEREAFRQYCQWYRETADRHRQELEKMRGDVNVFGWFCRGRSRGY